MELKAINVTCFSLRWGSSLHNMTAVRDWVIQTKNGTDHTLCDPVTPIKKGETRWVCKV